LSLGSRISSPRPAKERMKVRVLIQRALRARFKILPLI
jgi:hypothetical protein